jgi:hypothetical protein
MTMTERQTKAKISAKMAHEKNTQSKSSSADEFAEAYESALAKRWIENLPFDSMVNISNYEKKEYFKKVADIVPDNDVTAGGKKKGEKKRQTLIKFVPTISESEFKKTAEWIYTFTVNGKMVKFGGTRVGLDGRAKSYLTGHLIKERGKNESSSSTNYRIYNTFEFYLKLGCVIEMFAYEIEPQFVVTDILGEKQKVPISVFHVIESKIISDFQKTYPRKVLISYNSDPNHK